MMIWRTLSLILVTLTISCGGEHSRRSAGSSSASSASSANPPNSEKKPSSGQENSGMAPSGQVDPSMENSHSSQIKGYDQEDQEAIGFKLLMKHCSLCHDQSRDKEFFKTISKLSYKAIVENRMPKNNADFFKSDDKKLLLNWLATEFSAGPVVK
jgi:hypothetical protein